MDDETTQPQSDPHEAKRSLLQHLISSVLGAPANGIKDVVGGIKTALQAYKSFASEWDSISGKEQATKGAANAAPQAGQLRQMMQHIQPKASGFGSQGSFAPMPNTTPTQQPAPGQTPSTPTPPPAYNPSGGNSIATMAQQYPHGFTTPGSQSAVLPPTGQKPTGPSTGYTP